VKTTFIWNARNGLPSTPTQLKIAPFCHTFATPLLIPKPFDIEAAIVRILDENPNELV
jgi:hypothetical protein